MFNLVWYITVLIQIVLLYLILETKIYQALWWLLVAVLFDLSSSPLLYLVRGAFGTHSHSYAFTYYASDILCIAFYMIAAWGCVTHKSHWISSAGFIMFTYQIADAGGILILLFQSQDLALAVQTVLHFYNIATLGVLGIALVLYARAEVKPTKGANHA